MLAALCSVLLAQPGCAQYTLTAKPTRSFLRLLQDKPQMTLSMALQQPLAATVQQHVKLWLGQDVQVVLPSQSASLILQADLPATGSC